MMQQNSQEPIEAGSYSMSSVIQELERVNNSISDLDSLLLVLQDNLSPVLVQQHPEEEYEYTVPDVGMCRLAEQVHALNYRISQQIVFVERLNQKLNIEETK